MAHDLSKFDDVIDSRDVIARLEELEDERDAAIASVEDMDEDRLNELSAMDRELTQAEADELEALQDAAANGPSWVTPNGDVVGSNWDEERETEYQALRELADEAEGYAADWHHGETLIRDSYFEDYARQLAEDIGAIDRDAKWPNTCIDWAQAASELQRDYTAVDFDGETYWIR